MYQSWQWESLEFFTGFGYTTLQVAIQAHVILWEYSTHISCACFTKTAMVLFWKRDKDFVSVQNLEGPAKMQYSSPQTKQ